MSERGRVRESVIKRESVRERVIIGERIRVIIGERVRVRKRENVRVRREGKRDKREKFMETGPVLLGRPFPSPWLALCGWSG